MTLSELQANFGTEEQCRKYLYEKRWPEGFICPKCSHNEHFNIISRNLYQCKTCNHQASVTAGTIMDKTRTPLVKWFQAMYIMSRDKRGVSALALKSELGISYTTAWTMSNKIRHAMNKRDENYKLNGIVELDDAFFGASSSGGKRGRGTEKTAVLVSVSLTKEGKPLFAKMEVVENVDGETVKTFAQTNIDAGSEVRTDGFPTYGVLGKSGYSLTQKVFDPDKDPKYLHWTHIIISNAKAFINGTFHGLDSTHLQRYLDEFCYRLNRRWNKDNLFNRLVNACVNSGKITYYELCR
jgi:transposase-like protein